MWIVAKHFKENSSGIHFTGNGETAFGLLKHLQSPKTTTKTAHPKQVTGFRHWTVLLFCPTSVRGRRKCTVWPWGLQRYTMCLWGGWARLVHVALHYLTLRSFCRELCCKFDIPLMSFVWLFAFPYSWEKMKDVASCWNPCDFITQTAVFQTSRSNHRLLYSCWGE